MVKNESGVSKALSCFNAYFLIFSWFLNTAKKAKTKSINMTKKWKQWYIKTDSKLLICWLFLNALLLDLLNYRFIITLIFKPDFVQMGAHNYWSILQKKIENQWNKYQVTKTI